MDPTTLVTFLFKAPPEVRTVELLGSWDNFSKSYSMRHDRRRGQGFWSGCFNFSDIIFDGDKAEWIKPRSGGLKQGGTYWYFYRLNDAIEAFDDFKDYSSTCPLLPGQTVNVMDVPIEVEDPPSRRRSAGVDVLGSLAESQRTHTLDANDKWAALEPPPISKVHERCISDLALNGRLETKPHSMREAQRTTVVSPASAHSRCSVAASRRESTGNSRSLRSRDDWYSMPPSRGPSPIYNAYVDHQQCVETVALPAFSRLSTSYLDDRPSTRGGSSVFHYGLDLASRNADTLDSGTGDDYVDGPDFVLESIDSPLEPAGPVAPKSLVTPAQRQRSDSADAKPAALPSVHDTRFSQYTSSDIQPMERGSMESTSSTGLSEDDSGAVALDFCSPTFSAATISSNGGGLNTPFRLSGGYTRSTAPPSANIPRSKQNGDIEPTTTSIEHVTERLRRLGSEDSKDSLASHVSSDASGGGENRPAILEHYSLPSGSTGRAVTLGKASPRHANLDKALPPLPPVPAFSSSLRQLSGAQGDNSLSNDIFSELGFLSGSIT